MTLITTDPVTGARLARLWAKGDGKVNQGTRQLASFCRPNCHKPEPVTKASHERSRPKPAVPAWPREALQKGPKPRPPAALARSRGRRGRAGDSLRLAHGFGSACQ